MKDLPSLWLRGYKDRKGEKDEYKGVVLRKEIGSENLPLPIRRCTTITSTDGTFGCSFASEAISYGPTVADWFP